MIRRTSRRFVSRYDGSYGDHPLLQPRPSWRFELVLQAPPRSGHVGPALEPR